MVKASRVHRIVALAVRAAKLPAERRRHSRSGRHDARADRGQRLHQTAGDRPAQGRPHRGPSEGDSATSSHTSA